MKNAKLLILLSFLLLAGTASVSGQNAAATPTPQPKTNPTPCKDNPKCREFDFWVGEWDVFGPKGAQVGTNSIQLILDGCVLLENWTGAKGGSGKSFNLYNAQTGKWQQTWVDNSGGILELSGELKDGKMQFTGETVAKGQPTQQHRLTFTKRENGSIHQFWEISTDAGKTWQTAFDGTYVRKK